MRSWSGVNLLGGGDGAALDDPARAGAKQASKRRVTEEALGYVRQIGAALEIAPLVLREYAERYPSVNVELREFDFGEGDHQEYVESGTRDVVLIAGAALLMIGAFIWSLAT